MRWSEVVGADVAPHARLVSVREGSLTVAVEEPVWATQLRYLESAIVTRATALLGPGVVTRVKVRVGSG
jgi:predicted nucleic acid-binding Zn ribbon protein